MGEALLARRWDSWDSFSADTRQFRTWLWCDLGGLHLAASLPTRCPTATHLWGWGEAELIRVRVMGPQVVGATLHVSGHETELATQAWPENDLRVGMTGGEALRGAKFSMVTHPAAPSLVFLRAAVLGALGDRSS